MHKGNLDAEPLVIPRFFECISMCTTGVDRLIPVHLFQVAWTPAQFQNTCSATTGMRYSRAF